MKKYDLNQFSLVLNILKDEFPGHKVSQEDNPMSVQSLENVSSGFVPIVRSCIDTIILPFIRNNLILKDVPAGHLFRGSEFAIGKVSEIKEYLKNTYSPEAVPNNIFDSYSSDDLVSLHFERTITFPAYRCF
ncbi:hypothetical protein JW851_05075 [Candidatus Woesearchaeota archaeon]|nr:hypothetical protein [Candidatus Woesearchaeota archaeon]